MRIVLIILLPVVLMTSCRPLTNAEEKLVGLWGSPNGYSPPYLLHLESDRTALLTTFDPSVLDFKTTRLRWSLNDSAFILGKVAYPVRGIPDSINLKNAPFVESHQEGIFKRLESISIDAVKLRAALENRSWTLQEDSVFLIELNDKEYVDNKWGALERKLYKNGEEGWLDISILDWWVNTVGGCVFINNYKVIDSYYFGYTEQVVHFNEDTVVTYSLVENKQKVYCAKKKIDIEKQKNLLTGNWVCQVNHAIDSTKLPGYPYSHDKIFDGRIFMTLQNDGRYNFDLEGHTIHGDELWKLNNDGSIIIVMLGHNDGDTLVTQFHNIERLQNNTLKIRTDPTVLTEHGFFFIGDNLEFEKMD